MISGTDDRYNADDLLKIIANSRSVAFLLHNKDRTETQNHYTYPDKSFAELFKFPLLPNEKFYHERCLLGALGVAFLIEEDTLIAARHCINGRFRGYRADEVDIVFEHSVTNRSNRNCFPKSEVYAIKGYEPCENGEDLLKIRLARKVADRVPLKIYDGNISDTMRCYAIGYPLKLPRKIALNGKVCRLTARDFRTDLDLFAMNSGSPVFDEVTNTVIGVALRSSLDDTYIVKSNGTYYTALRKAKQDYAAITCTRYR